MSGLLLDVPSLTILVCQPLSTAMPPPTATQKPTKASGKDAAPAKPATAPSTSAASASAAGDEKRALTKPDQAKYNAEQDEINKQIADVKSKVVRP